MNVIFGSDNGLTAQNNRIWSQGEPGVVANPEPNNFYGTAVSAGDINDDGFDELAVGILEHFGRARQAGAVHILFGANGGLTPRGDRLWHQNDAGVLGVVEDGDLFGFSVQLADFNGDGAADLAAGVPGESIGRADNAGAVNVLYSNGANLTAQGDQLWHQNDPGIVGVIEEGDRLGWSLD